MPNPRLYEYINESSINEDLICSICNAPLENPRCTPCNHIFCCQCITKWVNGNNTTCPLCRGHLTLNNLTQAQPAIRSMLDELSIKCTICGHTGLKRSAFDDHFPKACPNAGVYI
jgi:hypothetical protein